MSDSQNVYPVTPPPPSRPRRRRLRNFALIWMVFTLLVGTVTCGAVYLVTGSLNTGDEASVEQQPAEQPMAAGDQPTAIPTSDAEVLAPPTPQPIAPQPTQPQEEVAQAPPPEPTSTPPPPTPVPTINAPLMEGTLPPDFMLGAKIEFTDLEALPREWDLMRVAGMDWIKIQLRYEPGMNANDFGWQVLAHNEQGFNVLWGVVGDKNQVLDPNYIQGYAKFVAGLAALGSGAIEVWNEPNLDREWPTGQVSGQSYVNLLRPAYEAIKAANAETLVISAGLAPTGFFGGCAAEGCDDDVYYQQLAAAGMADHADCIGAHYNEGIVSPQTTSGDPRSEYPTRYLMANTDRAYNPFNGRLPVCYTELGYLSSEGYGPLPPGFTWAENVTIAQHASWLATAALMLAESGKVDMMLVWNLDYTSYGDDPHAGYAMIRADGSCPACDSFGLLRPQ